MTPLLLASVSISYLVISLNWNGVIFYSLISYHENGLPQPSCLFSHWCSSLHSTSWTQFQSSCDRDGHTTKFKMLLHFWVILKLAAGQSKKCEGKKVFNEFSCPLFSMAPANWPTAPSTCVPQSSLWAHVCISGSPIAGAEWKGNQGYHSLGRKEERVKVEYWWYVEMFYIVSKYLQCLKTYF